MNWIRIAKSSQAFAAHTSLLSFTILLLLKLDQSVSYSWWIIFFPLFLFHAVVARGWFSLPGSCIFHGRHVHLLVAFELLLCVFLESAYVKNAPTVSLKIVFLPLLAFESTIVFHNLRMWNALLSGGYAILGDDPIWLTLQHFCITISIGFFAAATVFTLQKLSGDTSSLSWWHLFICFGIAECFAFLVCTKWSNAVVQRNSQIPRIMGSTEEISENRMCCLGGHVMKIPIIVFQILLCMRLEGKPAAARFISLPAVFSPIFLVQGLKVLFAASNLIMKIVILLPTGAHTSYYTYVARARNSLCFLQRAFRKTFAVLFVWWSTGDRNREQEALMQNESSRYNTFSGDPSETVKRLPKKNPTEEVRRLRAALSEQKENFERLQNDKLKCKICFDRDMNTVLLPCRHSNLCSICSEKFDKCPFCRVMVEERITSP